MENGSENVSQPDTVFSYRWDFSGTGMDYLNLYTRNADYDDGRKLLTVHVVIKEDFWSKQLPKLRELPLDFKLSILKELKDEELICYSRPSVRAVGSSLHAGELISHGPLLENTKLIPMEYKLVYQMAKDFGLAIPVFEE